MSAAGEDCGHCHEPGPFGPVLSCEKPKDHKGKWHACELTIQHLAGGSTTTKVRWRVTRRVLGAMFN